MSQKDIEDFLADARAYFGLRHPQSDAPDAAQNARDGEAPSVKGLRCAARLRRLAPGERR